jgi:hypothetical protein
MDDDLNRPNNNTAKPGNSKGDNTAKEAVEFLTQLRPPPWILIAINPDKSRDNIAAITAQSADDVLAFVNRHDGTSNLYYGVNPTKTALSKKPAKTDIAAVEYLLGDLDPRKDEKSEAAKARYLHQLNGAFEPKPTAIVDSGNGIQALWRLDQAIDLSRYPLTTNDEGKLKWGPEAEKIIADVEDRAKALMERLGSKAGTQNIDRILRLPGTINLPTKAKIEAGRVPCPTSGADKLIKLAERDAAKTKQELGVDLVAIFLDTMGLAACYENEDKAAQVQRVVSGLFRLSDATGALVIGVDHCGKDQHAGLRGSSAKRGHVETVLSCLVDRDKKDNATNHRMKFEKIRDGEEGRIVSYRLKQVDWGVDEDGDRVSTCVVQWEPQRPPPMSRTSPKFKTNVTLDAAIAEVALPADPDGLKAAFYKHHGGSKHAANTAWHRAVEASGLVLKDGKLDYPA